MGERTSYEHGVFCWVELGTSDEDGARDFYRRLFGWEMEARPMEEGFTYTTLRVDGKEVAGLYPATEGPPAWLSYVAVDDADAVAARAEELGGGVVSPAFDVMGIGRMAVLRDSTDAVFAVWQAKENAGATLVNTPGSLTLNQLNTSDPEAAASFYKELFGWRIDAVSGGEQPYWGIHVGDRLNGGMMALEGAPSHWLAYFGIDDLDAAAETIGAGGGEVMVPKTAVPGGEIVVAQDPQGAVFALFAGRFDD